METLDLHPRAKGLGTKPKQLRRDGILPLAIVDSNHTVTEAQTTIRSFEAALAKTEGIPKFDAKMEGESKPFQVIVKDIQKHQVDRHPIHVVLQKVTDSDIVKMSVHIVTVGDPATVAQGIASLTQQLDYLELKGRMDKMPENIQVDVSGLEENDKLLVSDLALPEGVECLTSPDATVVVTHTIRAMQIEAPETIAEAEAAAAAEAEAAPEAPAEEAPEEA